MEPDADTKVVKDDVSLTLRDCLDAGDLHQRSVMFGRGAVAATLVLALAAYIFGVYVIGHGRRWSDGWPEAAVAVAYMAALMLFVRYVWVPIATRRLYRKQPGRYGPFRLEWSDGSLLVEGAGLSSRAAWAVFSLCREDSKLFLLYHVPRVYQVLPKRWFTADEVARIRRDLVEAGVKQVGTVLT